MFLTWDEVQDKFEDSVKNAAGSVNFNEGIEAFFQLKMVSVYDSWENGRFTSIEDVNNHVRNLILEG